MREVMLNVMIGCGTIVSICLGIYFVLWIIACIKEFFR